MLAYGRPRRECTAAHDGLSRRVARRLVVSWFTVAAAACLVAACGTSGQGPAGGVDNPRSPFVVHVINSETGSVASVGQQNQVGLQAAAKVINSHGGIKGHPLQFDFADNQSTPSVAVSLAAPLIHSVPLMIVGGVGSVDEAVDQLASSSGPVVLDMSPVAVLTAGSYVFSTTASANALWQDILNYIEGSGSTRVAILNATDTSGTTVANYLAGKLAKAGSTARLVAHETYDPTALSVTSQVAIIGAAHPQALLIPETGTTLEVALKAIQQVPSLFRLPIFVTSGDADTALLQHFGSLVPPHLYFSGSPNLAGDANALREMGVSGANITRDEVFFKATKNLLGGSVQISYDTGMLTAHIFSHLGIDATASQIKSYLSSLKDYPAVGGTMNFVANPQRGLSESDGAVFEWNGANDTLVAVSRLGGRPMPHQAVTSTMSGR